MDDVASGQRAGRWPKQWGFESAYEMGSYRFRFRANEATIGRLMDRLLAHFRVGGSNGEPTYSLVRTGRKERPYSLFEGEWCINQADDPAGLMSYVLTAVSVEGVDRTKDALAIHAGAVSFKGEAVVLPAPPNHGKTTTVAGLVRGGFDYLSDEAAFIEPSTGEVIPFPRPLAMAESSIEAISRLSENLPDDHPSFSDDRIHVLPDYIRAGAIGRPCPVRFVVAPSYAPGEPTRLEPISRAEGIRVLVDNSFNFELFGGEGLQLLRRVVLNADCYRLSIGDLDSAVRAIKQVVEGSEQNTILTSAGKAD